MGTFISSNPTEAKNQEMGEEEDYFDYSPRAQWLRAIVLGSNEGLVLTTLQLIEEAGGKIMPNKMKPLPMEYLIMKGFISLLAGALTMATSEFVSVYTQVDIIRSQNERDLKMGKIGALARVQLPSPVQIAAAASISYIVMGLLPLLIAWTLRDDRSLMVRRSWVAAALASLLMVFVASFVGFLGKAPLIRSCLRILMGGWIEIGIMMLKGKVLENYGLY
ncbi:hypothetical protein M9H77_25612 [Catharanthus roseus]|uniref:Uncharacterized protein n=1 Tax=Catharanthus roseus TaxID=4058 RepID=A0ACC0A9G2_CATRO|nr:hypothetical protein M9H77_25612 [Catharanthus roseus]